MRTAASPAAQQVTFCFVFIKPKSNDRSSSQQTCGLAECKTTLIVWSQQVIMEVFVEVLCSIYVGEWKIIRTIGTCFAFGYTAGWSWQNTNGLLLSYHCGAGVTLIVHFCHEFFFAINMVTSNFICTKEEQRAVIHFCGLKVYHVLKCIEWCQCSMGTVSCHNGLSVNGARG